MALEAVTNCPFCGKETIKILHQPFVARKGMSKSRFGSGGPVFTKEKSDVLSGCEACGKSQKEVEKAMNGVAPISHEERLERLKKRGLPLVIESGN